MLSTWDGMATDRLARLPSRSLPGGVRMAEARSLRSRLLGLAFVRKLDPRAALLLRRCSCVHTFGMRFAIDVVFLDAEGDVLEVRHHVKPGRIVSCSRADAVVETLAGQSWRFLSPESRPGVPAGP